MSDDLGVPVDRVAQRVVQPGEHWQAPRDPRIVEQEARLMECLTNPRQIPLALKNLCGRKFGQMTVVCFGYTRTREGGNRNRGTIRNWVCRCDCGAHEFRKQATINQGNPADCCDRCQRARAMRRTQAYREKLHALQS